MKRIDDIIQGNEESLKARICENLKDNPALLKRWESSYDNQPTIDGKIEVTIKMLITSPLFYL